MIWLMNGAAASASTIINAGGAGYTPMGAADFNGDGKADLLWRRSSDGMLKIQLTDGAATEVSPGPAQFQLRTFADVDGDGKADIVWYKPGDGSAVAWLMNGAQHVSDQSYPAGASGYEVIGAGDFNADGKADLLWFRPSSDAMLAIQFTNGSWTLLDNADPGWKLRGLGDELVAGTPLPPLLLTPTGTIGTANPNYKWSASSRAASYYLLAQNTAGVAVGELHTAAELNCGIGMGLGTCTWTPASTLTNGSSYNWFVYAGNGEGAGQWSMPTAISISVAAPTVPVLITPSGTITTTSPQYQWNAFPGATAYYLLVQNTAGVAVSESHTAAEVGCASGGICSWISTSPLTNGTAYAWFVNATTPSGTTAWSDGNQLFVNAAGPSAPSAPAQLDPPVPQQR